MNFDFNEDQRLLQQTVRDFLTAECPVDRIRGLWDTTTGRSPELWKQLAEIGIPGLLVPEIHDGLGMDETDMVLLLEETGRAALAEPVVATAVGTALLRDGADAELAGKWLPRVASGEAQLAVGHRESPFVAEAHVADLLLLPHDDSIHALSPADVRLEPQPSNDGSQRLFRVDFDPSPASQFASGPPAAALPPSSSGPRTPCPSGTQSTVPARRQAAEPATRPYDPRHLMSTIMHTLFDIGQLRVTDGIPKPVIDTIVGGSPIEELV